MEGFVFNVVFSVVNVVYIVVGDGIVNWVVWVDSFIFVSL